MAMPWSRGSGAGARVGIALGDELAVAVLQGRTGASAGAVSGSFRPENPEVAADLSRAFRELKEVLERKTARSLDGVEVHVTLLPPLADARVLPFPPMRREEAETVLSRDVARYFLGATRAHVVTATPSYEVDAPAPDGTGGSSRVFAAAAPLGFLEVLRETLAGMGWTFGSLSASHGIWVDVADGLGDPGTRGVVAVVGERAHVLALKDGRPTGVRRVDVRDLDGVAKALGSGPGSVLVLSDAPRFDTLRDALSRHGWNAVRDAEGWGSAEETTAAHAAPGRLEFVPPSLREERRNARRRAGMGMGIAAVVLLLASAGIHLWGAHRELRALQERREAIREDVAPALLARDSLRALTARVRALEDLQASAPLWTRSLVEISALLPDDTYLTAFYARGDTVELEAAGTRGAEAIQTLRESGLFEDLRLQGIVERELNDGETVEERFSLRGRIPSARNGGVR